MDDFIRNFLYLFDSALFLFKIELFGITLQNWIFSIFIIGILLSFLSNQITFSKFK